MSFNEKLQKLRKEKGLSQEALAEMLDVSRQAVSKWESGVTYPEMDKLLSLCKIFDCTLEDLTNDNIKEVNLEKKNPYNLIIDSSLDFIKKSYNYFINNSLGENLKCLIIMLIVALVISVFKFPFDYLNNGIAKLFLSFGNNAIVDFINNLFSLIINLIYILLSLAAFIYIFKIGFLDKAKDDTYNEETINNNVIKPPKEDMIKTSKDQTKNKKDFSFINVIVSIVMFFVKLFLIFCLIPFVGGLVGLSVGLALIVYFAFKGLFYLGLLFIIISLISLFSLTIEFIFNILFNKTHAYKKMLITLIISLVTLGLGIGLFGTEISEITYINKPNGKFATKDYVQNINMKNDLYIDGHYHVNYEVDNTMNDIKIVATYYPKFYSIKTSYNAPAFEIYTINEGSFTPKEVINELINDLKNKEIYNYNIDDPEIIIYANEKNIQILKANAKEAIDRYNEDMYSKNIDSLEEKNESLRNNIDILKEENENLKEENESLKEEIKSYKTRIKEILE